ncbi:hypothetical protein BSKO_07384 [Bryopsis sp. KO-2023]|nr:hypothetical protein BSKO_07384 [Bryopsis sp. KO-2023]
MSTEGRSRYLVPNKEYEALKARHRDVEKRMSSLRTESATLLEKLGRVQQETKALEGLTIESSQRFEVDRVRWAARQNESRERGASLREKMASLKRGMSRLSARNEAASSILEKRRAWESLRTACVLKEQRREVLKEEARNLRKTVAENDCALQDMRNKLATALAPKRNQPKEISPSLRDNISGSDVPENVPGTSGEYHECGDDLLNTASNQTDAQETAALHTDDGEAENVEEEVFFDLPDAHGADFQVPEMELVTETQPEKASAVDGEKEATLDPPVALASKSDEETVPFVPSRHDNSEGIHDVPLQVDELHQCPFEQENRDVQFSDKGDATAGLASKSYLQHQDTGNEPLAGVEIVGQEEMETQSTIPLDKRDNCSVDEAASPRADSGKEIDGGVQIDGGAMEVEDMGLAVDGAIIENSGHSTEDPSDDCDHGNTPATSIQTPIKFYTPCTDFGTPLSVQSDADTPLPMDMSKVMVLYNNALFDGEPCSEAKLARPVLSVFEKSELSKVEAGQTPGPQEEKSPIMGLVEGSQESFASPSAAGTPSEVSIDWGQGEVSTQQGVSFAIRAGSEVMSMESTEQTPARQTRKRKSWFPSEGLRRSPRIAALQKKKEEDLEKKNLTSAEADEGQKPVGRPRKRGRSSKN